MAAGPDVCWYGVVANERIRMRVLARSSLGHARSSRAKSLQEHAGTMPMRALRVHGAACAESSVQSGAVMMALRFALDVRT